MVEDGTVITLSVACGFTDASSSMWIRINENTVVSYSQATFRNWVNYTYIISSDCQIVGGLNYLGGGIAAGNITLVAS